MPLYEYDCQNCKKVLEIIQKFSDPPLKECPQCGKPVSKLLSKTSFQLKGSGWYATDYKKGTASTKPEAPSAPKGNGGSDTGGTPKT